jgi:antitoxin PrlF
LQLWRDILRQVTLTFPSDLPTILLEESKNVGKEDRMTTTIRSKGQVTIPAEIREAAHLEEGDPVEVVVVEEGILLRPQKIIDASQAWFWTNPWQESVRRSVEQLASGEGPVFADRESFLAALDDE